MKVAPDRDADHSDNVAPSKTSEGLAGNKTSPASGISKYGEPIPAVTLGTTLQPTTDQTARARPQSHGPLSLQQKQTHVAVPTLGDKTNQPRASSPTDLTKHSGVALQTAEPSTATESKDDVTGIQPTLPMGSVGSV